jgi:uncharacterized membrane protein YkgB
MSLRQVAVLAMLTGIFFGGFAILFLLNRKGFYELNNINLASYNISGMNYRMWAILVVYFLTGILNLIFGIVILRGSRRPTAAYVGKILLILCATLWLSFGVFTPDFSTLQSNVLLLGRVVVMTWKGFHPRVEVEVMNAYVSPLTKPATID